MILFVKFLLGFFAFYLLLIALLYFKQNSLVYFPPDPSSINRASLDKFSKQEVLTSDGIRISGYFLPPQSGKPIILYFHGNASHPAWDVFRFSHLIDKGYGVLLAEYRGYDGNPGTPDEQGVYKDAVAYYSWLKSAEYKNNPRIIYGTSLGSGVAVDLAGKNSDIHALILEVTYANMADIGAFHYPYIPFAKYLMKNKFANESKINSVKAPILLLLAGQDKVTPVNFGLALAESIKGDKSVHVFEEANHVNVYDFGAAKIMDEFLDKHAKD